MPILSPRPNALLLRSVVALVHTQVSDNSLPFTRTPDNAPPRFREISHDHITFIFDLMTNTFGSCIFC